MVTLKLTQIGNSLGVVLPKEVLARLKVGKGDSLFLTEGPDGWRVSPYDPEIAEQFDEAAEIMHRRRSVLHELAK
ncbi:MAG: AbrB/MazE/SpoVT family DNA-binding domain-containing protein [Rhodanobacteraceae bacterium]|jgi:putative addiction module antidote|nr:AbrB/MazE/SpoVT family DNA-binding domain-containing protein [Rhodanobacteraceae bacterium]